jgi:hypothetical protein
MPDLGVDANAVSSALAALQLSAPCRLQAHLQMLVGLAAP